jgi:toxin ParE1/3/4
VVIWTPRARADLKAIHDHIAQDAPMNAKRVISAIVDKAGTLAELPRLGKVVPEADDPDLREIGVHSWRVIYHLRDHRASIVTVVHKRRQLVDEDIPPV